jgi:hypothetical protein
MMVSFMAAENTNAVAASSCSSIQEEVTKLREENAKLKATLGQNLAPVTPSSPQPVDCGSIDLRTAQIHVKCMTSKGTVFERVSRDNFGEAWKGPDGLIWSDRIGSNSQNYAMEMCKYLGGALPSRADLERGEAFGFREVLPRMKDQWYWSSSLNPVNSCYAASLHGNSGDIIHDHLENKFSFRCVGR